MTDEEFRKEIEDLTGMLEDFRRIKDRGLKKWLGREIRVQLIKILREH